MEKNLINSTFKRWKETNVIFDPEVVLAWLDKKPEAETPESILAWATAHPFINIFSSSVPDGIIKGGDKFVLHDIKVNPPRIKKGRKVMDDDIYDLFEHTRTYVPRGLSILEKIPANDKEKSEYHIVVYAMKKFTGGPGDEDEEEEEEEPADDGANLQGKAKWEYYFIEPHKNTAAIYRTTKENGDSAHLSFFSHAGNIYYLVGSKNVHMLIAEKSDIEKYKDPRFRVAGLIGACFIKTLETEFTPEKKNSFVKYMLTNQLTATYEFLQVEYQHIELFDFPVSKFRFIAFTFNSKLQELCFDLEEGTRVAREAGWETTSVEKYSFAEQNSLFDDIRFNTYGKEGSVLYYVNAEGRTIGMMKKKTVWYILVRAIREKTKGLIGSVSARIKKGGDIDANKTLSVFDTRLEQTMKQKQEWLKLTDSVTQQWLELSKEFLKWNFPKIVAQSFDAQSFINTYPAMWNQFLQETKSTDKI